MDIHTIINIDGQDYPFHFGMRVFWYVSNSGEIEFDEIDGRIESDYDAFLELFVIANKSALDRKQSDREAITKRTLEIAIDNDPSLMVELQEAFANSSVIEKLKDLNEEETEKKPTG